MIIDISFSSFPGIERRKNFNKKKTNIEPSGVLTQMWVQCLYPEDPCAEASDGAISQSTVRIK